MTRDRYTRTWRSRRGLVVGCLWLITITIALVACSPAHQRHLIADSRRAGKAVARGDREAVEEAVLIGARSRVDFESLGDEDTAKVWAAALRKPVAARPEALVTMGQGGPVPIVWTDAGWRFEEDPTDFYGQGTPRQALRAFVRATHRARWDVLVDLAPLRYRVGLSASDLEEAWTGGEYAEALAAARDRLEAGLDGPIYVDAEQAVLPLDADHSARLELEGDRWVVVDF